MQLLQELSYYVRYRAMSVAQLTRFSDGWVHYQHVLELAHQLDDLSSHLFCS